MYGRRLFPDYYFFWRRQAIRFGDGKSTQQFLSQFKDDAHALASLRSLLGESRGGNSVSQLTGDQVLAEVVNLILSGELGVVRGLTSQFAGSNASDRSSNPPPTQAGPPLGPGKKSEDPESDTFPPNLNGVAQAAALAAAAAGGAAFCPH